MANNEKIEIDLSIPGQLTERECHAIGALSSSLPKGALIVEAGVLFGLSSYHFSKNAPVGSEVVCIDPFLREDWIIEWVEKEQNVDVPFSKEAFEHYTKDCNNIRIIEGYSPDVVKGWDKMIDVYFDDAVHEDPIFSQNIDFWLPFIKPGGYLCGHDFRHNYTDITRRAIEIASQWSTTLHVVDNFYWIKREV